MGGRVCGEGEGRHERREVRRCGEARDACVCVCGGEREGMVNRELGGGAEALRDEGEGGQLCARDVREDEGEWDGRVLACLAPCVARAARVVCLCFCCCCCGWDVALLLLLRGRGFAEGAQERR